MEAKAITRHIRQSPRKIRILLDDLRGVNVESALNYLHFSKAKAAYQIEKTLSSAVANLMNKIDNKDVSVNSVYVKECFADGAPHLKRFRAASMGRISRINKKSSHLTIIVSTKKK
ncbi:MAG: 50S ribosomal protein L22 [bacterium TMED250]|nr:MAG: 50S ribosomal protein L22 [bacterium TMED250]|tara:strand:- start:1790 stop:2137 length:348 start_codon:yes stop_codon:yes gene_type:complete